MADMVPFHSSGTSSRRYYALVRQIEMASDTSEAERALLDEVEVIRARLATRAVSSAKLKEYLIILLYCASASVHGSVTCAHLKFALPTAVKLSEAGRDLSERRIGYLFCMEVMPPDHDLQLMLVNTLRKDTESAEVPRIALALQMLISRPTQDVIPAVEARLLDLISHPSPRIKALALQAIRSLAIVDPAIAHSDRIVRAVERRIRDGDESVVRAALLLSVDLVTAGRLNGKRLLDQCISLLQLPTVKNARNATAISVSATLKRAALRTVSLLLDANLMPSVDHLNDALPQILLVLQDAAKDNSMLALVLECFRTLSHYPLNLLSTYLTTPISASASSPTGAVSPMPALPTHPVGSIKHLLSSRSSNDHHTFLSCLQSLHVSLWSGNETHTTEEDHFIGFEEETPRSHPVPAVLEKWEVEKIMGFLDANDDVIRKLTLHVLLRVDRAIIEAYFGRSLAALQVMSPASPSSARREQYTLRLLEVVEALTAEPKDGAVYAKKLSDVLTSVETQPVTANNVTKSLMPNVMDTVLCMARDGSVDFQLQLITALMSIFGTERSSGDGQGDAALEMAADNSKSASSRGPTLTLLYVALTCEYGHIIPATSISAAIGSLAQLLAVHSPDMQIPILIAMMRLLPLCEPTHFEGQQAMEHVELLEAQNDASPNRKRSLAKRVTQFKQFYKDPSQLHNLFEVHKSTSLPELAIALDGIAMPRRGPLSSPRPMSPSSPSSVTRVLSSLRLNESLSKSKLRYTAYETPKSPPPMRRLHHHTSSRSGSSTSATRSVRSHSISTAEGELSKTITAGDLAIAAQTGRPLGGDTTPSTRAKRGRRIGSDASKQQPQQINNTVNRADLISLESPFLTDLPGDTILLQPMGTTLSQSNSHEGSTSFEDVWNSVEETATRARGWCEAPMEEIVRRLQVLGMSMDVVPADMPPFLGELKVLVHRSETSENQSVDSIDEHVTEVSQHGAIRLREGDEGTCLWQLRCKDEVLGHLVKTALSEDMS